MGDTYERFEFVVVSITPHSEPRITDGNPPVLDRVKIEAQGGTQGYPVLTWVQSVASDMPTVGQKFTMVRTPVKFGRAR